MNTERLSALADKLDTLPNFADDCDGEGWIDGSGWIDVESFDIGTWCRVGRRDRCGTVACVGGWTVLLFAETDRNDANLDLYDERHAALLLGLDYSVARQLFYPSTAWSAVTAARAAGVIRNLIRTGVVDWDCQL